MLCAQHRLQLHLDRANSGCESHPVTTHLLPMSFAGLPVCIVPRAQHPNLRLHTETHLIRGIKRKTRKMLKITISLLSTFCGYLYSRRYIVWSLYASSGAYCGLTCQNYLLINWNLLESRNHISTTVTNSISLILRILTENAQSPLCRIHTTTTTPHYHDHQPFTLQLNTIIQTQ